METVPLTQILQLEVLLGPLAGVALALALLLSLYGAWDKPPTLWTDMCAISSRVFYACLLAWLLLMTGVSRL